MTNWKDFKNWLETNVIEPDGPIAKLRPEKQIIYTNLTSNALNRFMDSLEATLDNDDTCHLFPDYARHKIFEDLFDPSACYFGKKTNKKRIGVESYQDLKKIFLDWRYDFEVVMRLNEDIDRLEEAVGKLTIGKKQLEKKVNDYLKERRELVVQKYNEIYNLETEIDDLKISLSNKNEEIIWLREQLKRSLGEEKYKNQIEINYPLKFKN